MNNKKSFKRKLLVVCGPTATGKTALGIKLAKINNGEIVSADSRQVYKYMDIGTGKEWGDVKIWGYDLVEPSENYSVSKYFESMKYAVEDIWNRNKLPVIVGGTGLYIKSLVDGIPTVDVPRNDSLRKSIEGLSIGELFDKLAVLDGTKAASLNYSDKNNPRRLVRAIEVAMWNVSNQTQKQVVEDRKEILGNNVDVLTIGLTADHETFLKNVENRVDKRINHGFIDEVEDLLKMGISWKMQSMNSLGYKDSEKFFKNGQSYEDFINSWVGNEMRYIKRQLTWFKKDKRVVWFNITDQEYDDNVVKLVDKWYSTDIND